MYSETDSKGVKYTLLIDAEDIPVEGNVLSSGDDAADYAAECEIERRLAMGDTWAWCVVSCEASYKGLTGVDYLGGCSYEGLAEFLAGGYWEDMKTQALADLMEKAKVGVELCGM